MSERPSDPLVYLAERLKTCIESPQVSYTLDNLFMGIIFVFVASRKGRLVCKHRNNLKIKFNEPSRFCSHQIIQVDDDTYGYVPKNARKSSRDSLIDDR